MDEIRGIDATAIEDLTRWREERDVLAGRLAAMEARRESVSEAVYQRVRDDYLARRQRLDEEGRPLKETARRELSRLEDLFAAAQRDRDEARVAKEELEFRRELGEFEEDEETFAERRDEASERLAGEEARCEELAALRQRFVEAFGSEEEIRAVAEAAEAESEAEPQAEAEEEQEEPESPWDAGGADTAVESPGDAPVEVELAESTEDAADASEEVTGEIAAIPPPPPAGGAAAEATAESWQDAATGLLASVEPPPAPAADDLGGATRILAQPRLVAFDGDAPGRTFVLTGARMTIGRSSENPIHLLEESISRRHAEVVVGPDGYVLHDLGSENGTYVNGQRTSEHLLREGDVVHIGIRKLVFHEI